MVSSCSKNEDYDPYTNWEARNVTWFQQVADITLRNIRSTPMDVSMTNGV